MKSTGNPPNELNLVSSSRLRAIREQQSLDKSSHNRFGSTQIHQNDVSDLMHAQQLIDEMIAQKLNELPVGKQRSLFKIRYGVDPSGIKQLPVLKVLNLLGISQQSLTNPQSLVDLNYNGDRI